MSRGLGKLQRELVKLMEDNPDLGWKLDDLADRMYGLGGPLYDDREVSTDNDIAMMQWERQKKAQHVAISRALSRITPVTSTWGVFYWMVKHEMADIWMSPKSSRMWVLYNRASTLSRATADVRTTSTNREIFCGENIGQRELRNRDDSANWYDRVWWWRHEQATAAYGAEQGVPVRLTGISDPGPRPPEEIARTDIEIGRALLEMRVLTNQDFLEVLAEKCPQLTCEAVVRCMKAAREVELSVALQGNAY